MTADRGWRNDTLPIFWEFVQHVLDNKLGENGGSQLLAGLKGFWGGTPVFCSSPDTLNEHWRPISLSCLPCSVGFDFLLRFESLEEEEPLLERRLGLEKTLSATAEAEAAGETPPAPWRNRNSPEQLGADQLTRLYFAQQGLTGREVERLYRTYEDDFLMFGYSFEFGELALPPPSPSSSSSSSTTTAEAATGAEKS